MARSVEEFYAELERKKQAKKTKIKNRILAVFGGAFVLFFVYILFPQNNGMSLVSDFIEKSKAKETAHCNWAGFVDYNNKDLFQTFVACQPGEGPKVKIKTKNT